MDRRLAWDVATHGIMWRMVTVHADQAAECMSNGMTGSHAGTCGMLMLRICRLIGKLDVLFDEVLHVGAC